ncbi:MAG: hypothetical protein IJS80_07670 [Lachnospiraceae bacterium]|nr:hypothetical protein [Lachnospiraceae bacterium]
MKKFTSLMLAAALACTVALAGCGKTAEDRVNASNTAAPTKTSASEAASTPAPTAAPTSTPTSTPTPTPVTYVYGTASLTYAEYYSGDVTSTDGFDAVSSATNKKNAIMSSMYTDFVDAETNASGYHILGVNNANIAVPEDQADEYAKINPTFVKTGSEAPAQYKTVTVADGKASYSATRFNTVAVVKDATTSLSTSSNWGDYLVCLYDTTETHLRNTREDNFDINSALQGMIVETADGLKVGLEALQSMWVQPYEFSFNVSKDSTRNSRISGWDNLTELAKLEGATIEKVYYIMADAVYEYDIEGVYVKPQYKGNAISAKRADAVITLSVNSFKNFENPMLTVIYTVGSGKQAKRTTVLTTALTDGTASYTADLSAIDLTAGGTFSASISSDNTADVAVVVE